MDLNDYIVRIIVCIVLSMLIGIERQYRHGTVGLRTNVLVALGAFMFNYATYGFFDHDESRIASSIVSGIGFIGAGMIIKDGKNIHGLNTAATLWCGAAIGLMTSIGMLYEAIIGTVLVIISNIILRILSFYIMDKINYYSKEECIIDITCTNEIEIVVRTALSKYVEKNYLRLISLDRDNNSKEVHLKIIIVTSRVQRIEDLVKNISCEPEVSHISWEHHKDYVSDNLDSLEED